MKGKISGYDVVLKRTVDKNPTKKRDKEVDDERNMIRVYNVVLKRTVLTKIVRIRSEKAIEK